MVDRLTRSRSRSPVLPPARLRTRTLEDIISTPSRKSSKSPKRSNNTTKASSKSFRPPKRMSRSLSPVRSKVVAELDWDDDDDDDDDYFSSSRDDNQPWKPPSKNAPLRTTTKSEVPKIFPTRGRSKISNKIGRKAASLSPMRSKKNKEPAKVKSYIFPDLEAEAERQDRKKGVKDSLFSFLDGVYDSCMDPNDS
jgi:hypothetical protein